MKTIKLTNTQLRKLIKEAIGESRGTVRVNIVVEIDAEDYLDGEGLHRSDKQRVVTQVANAVSSIGLEDQLMQEITDIDGIPVAVRSVVVDGLK